MQRTAAFREVLHWAIGAVVVLALVQTWFALGLVVPVTLSGSSMAPTLLGPHQFYACRCGHVFAVGLDQTPEDEAWCPACGRHEAVADRSRAAAASRVFVDRTAYSLGDIQRWDIVVFRCPEDARQLCIKRVLGMPGETVRFEGGDLWIDGQIVRKTLGRQLAVRQLVHREGEPQVRWRSRAAAGAWQWSGQAWLFEPAGSASLGEQHWLEYHQPAAAPRTREAPLGQQPVAGPGSGPITDELAYNQRLVRRPNVVPDLMLTMRVEMDHAGTLAVRAETAAGDFLATLDLPAREIAVSQNGAPLTEAILPAALPASRGSDGRIAFELTFSLFDRQMLLAADGIVLLQAAYEPAPPSRRNEHGNADALGAAPRPQRLAVAVTEAAAQITDLAVWRDVYYETRWQDEAAAIRRGAKAVPSSAVLSLIPPADSPIEWHLGAREYFVVGDNQALSDDSRSWPMGPGLKESLVVGRLAGER